MSANDSVSLRALAQAFQRGEISAASYRQQRTLLLDRLDSKVDIQEVDVTKPYLQREVGKRVVSQPVESDSGSQKKVFPHFFKIIGLVLVGVFVWMFVPLESVDKSEPVKKPFEKALSGKEKLQQTMVMVIANNDWSAGNIGGLVETWDRLSVEEKVSVGETVWFHEFIDSLHNRLLEQKALSEIQGEGSELEEQLLVSLARHLNMGVVEPVQRNN